MSSKNLKILLLYCLPICLTGFLFDAFVFYPGLLSPDSLDQYTQSVTGRYGDWHPPAMAGFWAILNHIYSGPQPMLVFQLLLFWTSCFLLTRIFLIRYGFVALVIPVLFFMPFLQNFVGVIWKDIQLSLVWLLAAVILINADLQNKKLSVFESIISLILLAYGCWVRSNAPPGFFPLACYWIYVTFRPTQQTHGFLRIILKGAAVSVIILLVQTFLNRVVLKADKNYIEYKLFIQDLSGIYMSTGELCFPSFITESPAFDTVYLKNNYNLTSIDNFWWNDENKIIFPGCNDSTVRVTRNYWLRTIIEHPKIYLKMRTIGFLHFLRITDSGSYLTITYPHIHQNDLGFSYSPNKIAKAMFRIIELQRKLPFMKPYFWFFLNFIVLFLAFHKKLTDIRFAILALSTSSLFFVLFEFIVYPADTEFRYFYWNCLSLTVCAALIIAELLKRLKSKKNEIPV